MVTLRVWYREAEAIKVEDVRALDYGKAFDVATARGAWRALDGLGQVFRRIEGEWFAV